MAEEGNGEGGAVPHGEQKSCKESGSLKRAVVGREGRNEAEISPTSLVLQTAAHGYGSLSRLPPLLTGHARISPALA